ncbi:lipase precursor-like protein [Leptomonas pyrrhocoris]|uniref:Lipase-like protein n=1 Tax=Leptomonas pyrrhocoris TaxID=157538 RepID=A0A0M9FYZ7_LEPPY|nr:lipase precursor-like protein [Leptomonas pyrrhocoris]XP_015657424.1 lipase precursor-like protein [Leptomonas pyrrhocoris]XP_015657425.1 lipase precursor-like protein [Leptomonas pyrrhocoris]KPA78984.1 lipase precursor-like protein [Leptomonas pyrrhocoris]KPA78985.1 lipase precursor-like protein [Leptomonas pyrrhocoris]KPA78986.1 lipase precursor-like protein [Leptomonas pyrrhocoris]|eukprot:XP_015657423.1 lipase precursor-like protein [Leptomonas pyrrhocoris]
MGRRCATRLLLCAAVLLACCLCGCAARREFSEADAMRYHYYEAASYCGASAVEAWTCGRVCSHVPGFQTFAVLDNDDFGTQGFVGVDHNNSQIVVAFRGSSDLANWLMDLLAKSIAYKPTSCGSACEVHTGFMLSYLSVCSEMHHAVQTLLGTYPNYGIVVTGHSLGGAMATLAAAGLQEVLNEGNFTPAPQPVTLYTYGSPRVGNAAFVQWVTDLLSNGASYRVTHERDPVVRLPPISWGYAHLPGEVFYRHDAVSSRVMCVDTVTQPDKKCSIGMFSVIVSDHLNYMGEYTGCDSDSLQARAPVPALPKRLYLLILWEYVKYIF